MIYSRPATTSDLDQGDIVDNLPILELLSLNMDSLGRPDVEAFNHRVLVLTQTCDLANDKTKSVTVAEVFEAEHLVNEGVLKSTDVRGPLRAGRIWGWYFLPAYPPFGLLEMIVDLRRLHTVRLDLLRDLCLAGHRKARVNTPYREHLSKHFADTFCRIGLPVPYETM